MRKKYIFINTLILLSSLTIFLVVSIIVLARLNERNTNTSINNYLNIVLEEYDGTNMESVSNMLHSSNENLRITFISDDGTVLYDTSSMENESNHLDRPEIKNLGTVSRRYSNTTNIKMYYLASFDEKDNVYIRVSIPESYVSDIVNKFTYIGLIGIVVLSVVSFFFIYLSSKKVVKPLKEEINKLSRITNTNIVYNGDDLVELSSQIEGVRELIDSNIQSIKAETEKLNYIINNMDSGVIIISGLGNVILINDLALRVLDIKKADTSKSRYIKLFDSELSDAIENAILEKSENTYTYKKDNKIYSIIVTSLNSDFVRCGKKNGVSIFIHDITEAKRLEEVKLDFFSNASHELKSPLTSIIGYQQLISEGILTSEDEIKEATSKTVKEANRMNQIIVEMLDLSKLEMDKKVEKTDLSLSKSIETVLESFDVLISDKNITVEKIYDDFKVHMNIDELYHILRNLVDNAIKYNKINGKITIFLDSINSKLIIKDTGIGISDEHLTRIFERFYRVDKAKSKELGGTGLGLAIVKHICMNNNITIDVSSKLNEGTAFTLTFKRDGK